MNRTTSIAAQWARIIALAVVGAAVFETLLPLVWTRVKSWPDPDPFTWWFAAALVWLATFVIFYVLVEPFRIRAGQWRIRRIAAYPPLWLSVVGAWGVAALIEWLAPVQSAGPDWQHFYPSGYIAIAFALAIVLRQLPLVDTGSVTPVDTGRSELTWATLSEWIKVERPQSGTERDLFNHRPIARRIANAIRQQRQRGIALLGPFGSGKSGIVNFVKGELERDKALFVCAGLNAWAISDPEDAPRVALEQIITSLDRVVDTQRLRRLPASYQRLAAAEPSGWLSKLVSPDSDNDPLNELQALSPILEAIDANVVLFIQDVERAGPNFDTRHLERLLATLHKVNRMYFVLSVDPHHTKIDYVKLCETVELIPPLDTDHVAEVLSTAYAHWLTAYKFLDPRDEAERSGKFRLDHALMGGLMGYMRKTGRDAPVDAFTTLLGSPRALKHVLRRVDRVWANLHGEVLLDDVLIIAALRHGAQNVYQFLVTDIDPARRKPDDILPRTQTVRKDWDRLLDKHPARVAVQHLVDLMGIEQLLKGSVLSSASNLPQSVHESEPVDYFRRIIAEEMSSDELCDQTVLADIEQWKSTKVDRPLIEKLVNADSADDLYARVWEYFARLRHEPEDLLQIASSIIGALLARDGAAARADHPGLIAVWRRCLETLKRNEHADWIDAQIGRAVRISLNFANGFFYFWTGDRGLVDGSVKERLRERLVAAARVAIATPDELIRLLSPKYPYTLIRLITETGERRGPEPFKEWSWLADIVIAASRTNPDRIVPEMTILFGDKDSGMTTARDEYPPVFVNPFKFDRANTSAFFGNRLAEALDIFIIYRGENVYAIRPRNEAKQWLTELKTVAT